MIGRGAFMIKDFLWKWGASVFVDAAKTLGRKRGFNGSERKRAKSGAI